MKESLSWGIKSIFIRTYLKTCSPKKVAKTAPIFYVNKTDFKRWDWYHLKSVLFSKIWGAFLQFFWVSNFKYVLIKMDFSDSQVYMHCSEFQVDFRLNVNFANNKLAMGEASRWLSSQDLWNFSNSWEDIMAITTRAF